jgi:hypothetical protein
VFIVSPACPFFPKGFSDSVSPPLRIVHKIHATLPKEYSYPAVVYDIRRRAKAITHGSGQLSHQWHDFSVVPVGFEKLPHSKRVGAGKTPQIRVMPLNKSG